jgi:PAS domain-containing protein
VGGLAESIREMTSVLVRERMEREARQAYEEHYSTTFNASHDALFIHNLEGRITSFNETARHSWDQLEGASLLGIARDLAGPGNPVEELLSI